MATRPARERAEAWLRRTLANGPLPSSELRRRAVEEAGVSLLTYKRVCTEIGTVHYREGFGPKGHYMTWLPGTPRPLSGTERETLKRLVANENRKTTTGGPTINRSEEMRARQERLSLAKKGDISKAELLERAERAHSLLRRDPAIDGMLLLSYVVWPSPEMEALFHERREAHEDAA